jgi:hypothetical protein
MLASGTMNTLSFKFQNKHNFQHGVLQTSLMFVGEYLNLCLFAGSLLFNNGLKNHFSEIKKKSDKTNKKLQFSSLWMAIPSFCDSIGSILKITSLLLIPLLLTKCYEEESSFLLACSQEYF